MIRFTETHLELSRGVCKALLAFVSKDQTRPHLSCVGFDHGDPCATDGRTAVRFLGGTGAAEFRNRVFSREYAETQLKIAIATKSETVSLEWSKATNLQFPPLSEVEKTQVSWSTLSTIGVSAAYLARLDLVARACAGDRKNIPPVCFVSLEQGYEPLGIKVDDTVNGGLAAHVTIMPVRL